MYNMKEPHGVLGMPDEDEARGPATWTEWRAEQDRPHITALEAEVERLRVIEAAARRLMSAEECWLDETAVHMYLRGVPCEHCEAEKALRALLPPA